MASLLESALTALLDGLGSVKGPGEDATAFLNKLGFAAPEGARDNLNAIVAAIPMGGAVGIGGGLTPLLNQVRTFLDAIQVQPAAFVGDLAAYGTFLKDNLPRRLIDYVMVTETQKRVPLVAGLLRMAGVFSITYVAAPPDPKLEVPGPRYVVDLNQLMLLVKDPKAGLRWGQVDFKSPAVVWGLEDVVRAITGQALRKEDERLKLARAQESELLHRDAGDVPESAAAAIEIDGQKIRLAGLHEQGLVVVPLSVSFDVGMPPSAKQGIDNGTGIDPDVLDKPGLWIAPDAIKPLPKAGELLPSGAGDA